MGERKGEVEGDYSGCWGGKGSCALFPYWSRNSLWISNLMRKYYGREEAFGCDGAEGALSILSANTVISECYGVNAFIKCICPLLIPFINTYTFCHTRLRKDMGSIMQTLVANMEDGENNQRHSNNGLVIVLSLVTSCLRSLKVGLKNNLIFTTLRW